MGENLYCKFKGDRLIMEQTILDILNTLLGVVAGGIISIIISNLVNKQSMKKQFMFDLLSEIKILLREWGNELLENGVEFYECENIKQYKGYKLSNSKRILIQKIETNKCILEYFNSEFNKIRNEDLRIECKNLENKKELLKLSKKYNNENTHELIEYKDISSIIENYAQDILGLNNEIETLIAKIDNYIYTKILK